MSKDKTVVSDLKKIIKIQEKIIKKQAVPKPRSQKVQKHNI